MDITLVNTEINQKSKTHCE